MKIAGLEPNMHLTCTNMESSKITEALEGAKAAGIHNICALRGGELGTRVGVTGLWCAHAGSAEVRVSCAECGAARKRVHSDKE